MPTTTFATLRQKVIKKLYAARFPIVGTTTSDSDSRTLITDTQLSPAAQIEDYIEVWVYIAEQAAAVDSETNINEGAQVRYRLTTCCPALLFPLRFQQLRLGPQGTQARCGVGRCRL